MIDLLNPQNMTQEDWEQLDVEAAEIDKEISEHKEELDAAMKELPADFFDKMHDELMTKIDEYEKQKAAERFLKFVFGDE